MEDKPLRKNTPNTAFIAAIPIAVVLGAAAVGAGLKLAPAGKSNPLTNALHACTTGRDVTIVYHYVDPTEVDGKRLSAFAITCSSGTVQDAEQLDRILKLRKQTKEKTSD